MTQAILCGLQKPRKSCLLLGPTLRTFRPNRRPIGQEGASFIAAVGSTIRVALMLPLFGARDASSLEKPCRYLKVASLTCVVPLAQHEYLPTP